IEGSFRLPVLPQEVPTDASWKPSALKDPRPSAVVPVTLVVLGSDAVGPWVHRLSLAVYRPLEQSDGPHPMATGHFMVDLFSLPGMATTPRTLFVYAFADAHTTPAQAVGVVSPEMLNR